MKIERINDTDFRCVLTTEDLAARHLKLSQLKYGNPKADKFFLDIFREASLKYGFDTISADGLVHYACNAVPLDKKGTLSLVFNRVSGIDELDSRYCRYSPSVMEDDTDDEDIEDALNPFDDIDAPEEIKELFNKICEEAAGIVGGEVSISLISSDGVIQSRGGNEQPVLHASVPSSKQKVFAFSSMINIMKPSALIDSFYDGYNSLYKDSTTGEYLLFITEPEDTDNNQFSKACNILSEYGKLKRDGHTGEAYLEEHCEAIFKGNAISKLSK